MGIRERWLGRTVIVAALGSVVALLLVASIAHSILYKERTDAARQLHHLLHAALENAMLKRDVAGLEQIVVYLGEIPGISRVLLTTPQGEVRFSSDPTLLGEWLSLPSTLSPEVIFTPLKTTELRALLAVPNRSNCLECHGPVEQNPINGFLIIDHHINSLTAGITHLTLWIAIAGTAVLALTLALLWRWWDRSLLTRLAAIEKTVSCWQAGALEVSIPLPPSPFPDELDRLADHLQKMAKTLAQLLERQKSERRFVQEILDSLPDGVRIIRTSDHIVLYQNRRFSEFIGTSLLPSGENHSSAQSLAVGDEIPSHRCHEAYGYSTPCIDTLVICPLTNSEATHFLHTFTTPDGRPCALEIEATRILSPDGAETYLVEVARKPEQTLTISQEQRLAELGMLAAGVAHEIHNPLATIRLSVQGLEVDLREGRLNDQQLLNYLHAIDSKIDECLTVTTRLLLLARRSEHRVGPVLLQRAVEDTFQLLSFEAEQRAIRHHLRAPSQPIYLEGDETEIRQILFNLVQNAHHAMPHGGDVTVTISHQPQVIVLTVADTGVGIPPDILPHIFKPFFSRRADQVTGTGLGLTIVQSLVESHGGSITVSSVLGVGTSFTITFPHPTQPCSPSSL